ncbi:hypothetical protein KCP75_25385 [Salmonella enterica subsp. enterica]|nr:hypothetical protein KCP75_25385 [Salmonella enterica subsp. enterica]
MTGRAFRAGSPLVAQGDDMTLFTTLLVLLSSACLSWASTGAARSSAGGAIPSDYAFSMLRAMGMTTSRWW